LQLSGYSRKAYSGNDKEENRNQLIRYSLTFKKNNSFILSVIIVLLATIASAGGLLLKNLYQDNAFVKSAWFTNDIITLFVVVPLLILSIYFSKKGSQQWLLIELGLLGYVFYNFAFYLFGAAFNVFFLIYTALFSMSAIVLILIFTESDIKAICSKFSEKTPVKGISIYLLLITTMLIIVESSMIIPFITLL
jgi:hypothetical protein